MSNATAMLEPFDGEELLGKLLDDALAASEQDALRERLAADLDLRQRYADMLHLHALLHWQQSDSFPGLAEKQQRSEDDDEIELASRWTSLRWAIWDVIVHPTALASLISALFITSILLSLALWTIPMLRPEDNQPPTASAADYVARIERTYQAVWSAESEMETNQKVDLQRGRQLELTGGLAEVRFDDGALVLLEAPCTFIPRNDGRMQLVSGKLNAKVPPSAVGFTVETKLADFVDLGTEFGVQVVEAGEIRSHVYHGQVRVVLADGEQSPVLVAGQSIRIGASGAEVLAKSPATDKFVRAMPLPRAPVPRPLQVERFDGQGNVELIAGAEMIEGQLVLAADDDHAVVRDEQPEANLSDAYSVALWFQPAKIRQQNILVRTNAEGATLRYSHQLLMTADGRLVHYAHDGHTRFVVNAEPLIAGRWYHVVIAAKAGGPMQFYIDGAKVAEWTGGLGQFWPDGDRFHVGGPAKSVFQEATLTLTGMQGSVRDLQVFDRVLRAAEVRSLVLQNGAPQNIPD